MALIVPDPHKGGRPKVARRFQHHRLLGVKLTDAEADAFIEKAYRDCTTVSAQLRILVTHHLTSVVASH